MILENLVFSNKTEFLAKVKYVAQRLQTNPDYLMAVMAFESSISASAKNKATGATGLIQFMPATAKSLGTTTEELATMSNVDQLDFVYKYLKPYAGRLKNLTDVYFAVFFPVAIGKAETWVLQTSSLLASKIAVQNPIFDRNKDGVITVEEVKDSLNEWLKKKI